jgi:hypothetical protein
MAVPCELAKFESDMTQTLVAHVSDHSQLEAFACSKIVQGDGAAAVVRCGVDGYLVLTCRSPHRASNFPKLKREIEQLPGQPTVLGIEPLTRRLQRLLGWGDVLTTRADVERAVAARDTDQLYRIMPAAKSLIDRGDLEVLPVLSDTPMDELLMIEGCRHIFFEEMPCQRIMGPCAIGLPGGCESARNHTPPYTRCSQCRVVYCGRCALSLNDVANDREERRGAAEHMRAQPPPQFLQHPERPLPFYVIDQRKPRKAEQIEWIKFEIGDDAGLLEFAQKYLELFANVVHGAGSQRAKCLALFAQYHPEDCTDWRHRNGRVETSESAVPPYVRSQFLRVWMPDQPQLCDDCGCKVATSLLHRFCVDCSNYDTNRRLWAKHGPKAKGFVTPEVAACIWFTGFKFNRGVCNASTSQSFKTSEPEWKRQRRS